MINIFCQKYNYFAYISVKIMLKVKSFIFEVYKCSIFDKKINDMKTEFKGTKGEWVIKNTVTSSFYGVQKKAIFP